ncbi:MAG: helix-turn-helix domain-containing protein [Akkermansiaceae bacterium]
MDCGPDHKTFRRLNESGIDGLTYKPLPGRPQILDCETLTSEILPVVDDPSLAGGKPLDRTQAAWLAQGRL